MPTFSRADYLCSEIHLWRPPLRGRGRAVLLFPNTYHLGMSSLSVHTLYSLLNAGGLPCERAFLPERGVSGGVRSLETDTPLGGFDFVLITTSWELDWLNIPALLHSGGVPPLRAQRSERHPMVIMGGPAVSANPQPLADLMDACVIGELEPISAEFIAALRDSKTREEVLQRLAALPGLYVPEVTTVGVSGSGPISRLHAAEVRSFSTESAVLTPHTEFAERFLIEVGRGCGRGCRFCLARQLYAPVRMRPPELLLRRVEAVLEFTRAVGLVGAAVSDYPWGNELFAGLEKLGAKVSVSSVRAESVTEAMLSALAASGQETLTIAPEAGAEPLRQAIGKHVSDEQLIDSVRRALAAGLRRFKLYFMIGLPGESDSDVLAIPRLLTELRRAAPGAIFSVSVTPFVPRPHTPLERAAMLDGRSLRQRMQALSGALRRSGVSEVAVASPRWAEAETVLCRGGRELGGAIVEASLAGGGLRVLKEAVTRTGRNWQERLGVPPWPTGEAPWDVVEC